MNRTPIWIAIILVFGALALGALVLSASDQRLFVPELDNPMVMRVYDVPAERAQDIRVALSAVLSTGTEKTPSLGRATLSGTNQIVVLAPLSTQSTIAAAVEKLGGGKSAAVYGSGSVRLSLWLVDAIPGAGSDDRATGAIAAALAEARSTMGEVHFEVHDAVTLTGLPNGGRMEAFSGRRTSVKAELRPIAGGVQGELEIGGGEPGNVKLGVSLKFQQTLVLAELARHDDGDTRPGTRRIFVVQAEPIGGDG